MDATAERLDESTRKRVVLIACILGSAVVFIDMTVVNVALPSIQRDLRGGATPPEMGGVADLPPPRPPLPPRRSPRGPLRGGRGFPPPAPPVGPRPVSR